MKRLLKYNLIPEVFLTIIMGVIVSFDKIPQFLMGISDLCISIHTFILPLYYIGVFWVAHFEYGVRCIKGAFGTILSGVWAGIIFYGMFDVIESIKTGVIRIFLFDYEHLSIMLLPQVIIIPGVIIISFISFLGRLVKGCKQNSNEE